MLVIIPAITSPSIDKNILPGVAKALERYFLIWHLDEVLKEATPKTPTVVGTVGKRMQEQQIVKEQKGGGSYKLGNFETLGIEPTYITVEVDGQEQMVGAKVVFFPLKTDGAFLETLLGDIGTTNWVRVQVIRMARALKKLWIRVLDKIPVIKHFFGRRALTGEVYDDVIIERSSHGGRVILCFSASDIEESGIEESGAMPGRLFKLGWKSIVICNDVTQTSTFCMQEQKGVCYTVPYSVLFSVSKSGYQVFADQADLKKRSSPFFSRRLNVKRLFRECKSFVTTLKYLMEISKERD